MKLLLCFSVFIFHIYQVDAQPSKLVVPDSSLHYFYENYPQEKVFLQTDRTRYISGETIWMKAWCIYSGTPSYLSRIIYVNLVNESGTVMQKKMYKLDSLSSTIPAMDIPKNLPSGNYSVNAYSLWMLNFSDYICKKNIYIYNNDYSPNKKVSKPLPIKVGFFPEGGELIAGVDNHVAFKIVDGSGLPIAAKGFITDASNKRIVDFETVHDGMGVFTLPAASGQKYAAHFDAVNNAEQQYLLPTSKDEGIALIVDNKNSNRMFLTINRAEKNKDKYNNLKVVAQMNYQVAFKANINLDEGQSVVSINKKNLPGGIMQVTVFDVNNMPLVERLVFVENYQVDKPSIQWDTVVTKARKRNQVYFKLPTSLQTSLSCVVTNASLDSTRTYDDHLASSLLLTSDLLGEIYKPAYYFIDKSADRLSHLDLLMMTQGWRRYSWNKILKNEYPILKYPVESAMVFTGLVTKSDSKQIIKEGNVSFIIKGEDSTSLLADASITDKGEFLLSDVNFMKKASVSYMGTNKKKESFIVDVKLYPSYIDSLSYSFSKPTVNLDSFDVSKTKTDLSVYLKRQLFFQDSLDKTSTALANVTVKAKKLSREDSLNNAYAEGPFLMGKSIDPSQFKFARNVWQVIQQTVPGVTVEGNIFDPTVSFNRFSSLGGGANVDEATGVVLEENGIAYYLNEINVSKDVLNTIAVEDIAFIKVLKNEAAALGASQGAIAIYTKKGTVIGKNPYDKTYTKVEKEGYAVLKEYYSPDYFLDPELNKDVLDNRFTLFFSGSLKPRKDGRYSFHFFNNDISKKYKIIIQGIDKQGNLIYGEQVFQ